MFHLVMDNIYFHISDPQDREIGARFGRLSSYRDFLVWNDVILSKQRITQLMYL